MVYLVPPFEKRSVLPLKEKPMVVSGQRSVLVLVEELNWQQRKEWLLVLAKKLLRPLLGHFQPRRHRRSVRMHA